MRTVPILLSLLFFIAVPFSVAESATVKEIKQQIKETKKINTEITSTARKEFNKSVRELRKANRALRIAQTKKEKAELRLARLKEKYPDATPKQQKILAQAIAKAEKDLSAAKLSIEDQENLIADAQSKVTEAAGNLVTATENAAEAANKNQESQELFNKVKDQKTQIDTALAAIKEQIKAGNTGQADTDVTKLVDAINAQKTAFDNLVSAINNNVTGQALEDLKDAADGAATALKDVTDGIKPPSPA